MASPFWIELNMKTYMRVVFSWNYILLYIDMLSALYENPMG